MGFRDELQNNLYNIFAIHSFAKSRINRSSPFDGGGPGWG
jgi:hypothetical protein